MKCGLCDAAEEEYRIVKKSKHFYCAVPMTPLVEGHLMIVPLRHVKLEDLHSEELLELQVMLVNIKDKLVEKYPDTPPLIVTHSNATHASIPDHFHYHIAPSKACLRELMSTYNPEIPKNKQASHEELKRLARLLKE